MEVCARTCLLLSLIKIMSRDEDVIGRAVSRKHLANPDRMNSQCVRGQ